MGNPLEEIRKYYPSKLKELKRVIFVEQASESLETRHELTGSLPERMKEIVNAKGATTKYYVY